MKHQKFVKQLMALGIQRNDAAGFVKASRILMDKGMAHKVPGVLDQRPPIIVSDREIRTLTAEVSTNWLFEMTLMPAKEKEDNIKRKLGVELCKHLLGNGMCKIQARADARTGGVVYRATIDVAVPREECDGLRADFVATDELDLWPKENPNLGASKDEFQRKYMGRWVGLDLANGPDFSPGGGGND